MYTTSESIQDTSIRYNITIMYIIGYTLQHSLVLISSAQKQGAKRLVCNLLLLLPLLTLPDLKNEAPDIKNSEKKILTFFLCLAASTKLFKFYLQLLPTTPTIKCTFIRACMFKLNLCQAGSSRHHHHQYQTISEEKQQKRWILKCLVRLWKNFSWFLFLRQSPA